MTQLNQNRYDQLLRRVGDLKGPGSKVNDALTELFPMVDVENVPAELLLLGASRLCMGRTSTAAGGVGNFGIHLLRNNIGSGVVARLMQVSVQGTNPESINCGPTQNSGTPGGVRAFADTRVFGEGTAVVLHEDNNSLVTGSSFFIFNVDVDNQAWWEPPAAISVVTPGAAFSVANGVANQALDVSWLWIERQAQPSELNL